MPCFFFARSFVPSLLPIFHESIITDLQFIFELRKAECVECDAEHLGIIRAYLSAQHKFIDSVGLICCDVTSSRTITYDETTSKARNALCKINLCHLMQLERERSKAQSDLIFFIPTVIDPNDVCSLPFHFSNFYSIESLAAKRRWNITVRRDLCSQSHVISIAAIKSRSLHISSLSLLKHLMSLVA